jgi:c-di-GMP-binding flagellar brake protein YcgR
MQVGKPLPWAIYDESGRLLLNQGAAPTSQAQINAMVERGLFRRGGTGAGTSTSGNGPRPAIPPMGLGPREDDSARLAGIPMPFDDLAMQPGEILQLHPALEVVAADLPAVLIGYLKNRAIVVATPVVSGKPILVKDGTLFNIKTFSGTSLYSFRTRVLAAHTQPMPHLHLEYPKLVYATKIRKALRAFVELPATLQDPGSGCCLDVVLKDLSVGGAQLVLPEPAAGSPGDRFVVAFSVRIGDDLEEVVSADAVMRASESRQVKEKTVHTMGVQFKELPKSARLAIMALVYRQQLRKG